MSLSLNALPAQGKEKKLFEEVHDLMRFKH
jgi:hypothetical protein